MALIIEDGTGVTGSNSFVTLGEFRDHAAARGVSLPVDDAACEILLIKAMDYLAEYEPQMVGVRIDEDQSLFWPRRPDPEESPAPAWQGVVPSSWRLLQLKLGVYALDGPLTLAERPDDRGAVKAVTVGPIKTEYAGAPSGLAQPRFRDVERLLAQWLTRSIRGVSAIANRG